MPAKTAALQLRLDALSDGIKVALAEGDSNDFDSIVAHFSHTRISQLAMQVIEWREDSKTLVKSIHRQLDISRELRSTDTLKILNNESEMIQSTDGLFSQVDPSLSQKSDKIDELAFIRMLRSDLLLLYEYRLTLHQRCVQEERDSQYDENTDSDVERRILVMEQVEKEAQKISGLLQRIKREEKEKQQRVTVQQRIFRDLLYLKSELMLHVTQDNLKICEWLNSEFGFNNDPSDRTKHSDGEKIQCHMRSPLMALRYIDEPQDDLLASNDVQAFVILMEKLQTLYQKARHRSNKTGESKQSLEHQFTTAGAAMSVPFTPHVHSAPRTEGNALVDSPLHPNIQKNNFAESVVPETATMLYLEDQVAYHRAKSIQEQESRNWEQRIYHTNIERLENMAVASSKAVEALELNVELVTNLYKALNEANTAQEHYLKRVMQERDSLAKLLTVEIRKFSALKHDNERKDKLIQIAMGARHTMQQFAQSQQQLALTAAESLQNMEIQLGIKTKLLADDQLKFGEISQKVKLSEVELKSAQAEIYELKKRLEPFLISQEIVSIQSEDHDVN